MDNLPIEKTSTRIKKLMDTYHVTVADISERTGLNRTTIWKYINDKQAPRQNKIYILASKFGVNPAWLLGYDVPMRLEDSVDAEYRQDIPGNSEIILEIARVISDMDKGQLEKILSYAYGLRDGSR